MKHKFLSISFACALTCGCASSTTPRLTENVNTALAPNHERLAILNAIAVQQQEHDQERSSLMQKIQELGNELSGLKEKMVAGGDLSVTNLQKSGSAAPVPNAVPPSAAVAKTKAFRTKPKNADITELNRASRETIVIQDSGMIFRVMHPFAKTEFKPSRSLQQQLLQAARAGKRIEIRGRTDAAAPNEIDRNIAMQRALKARVFLANNGIHPRKMHINYMASGDNIADNRTADGRARNRRVEIETAGISADTLEDMAALIRKDLQ